MLLVMKFGGTSMGSAERIRVAAHLIQEQRAQRPVVVVVSAISKITDLLLDTMKHAEARDEAGIEQNVRLLRRRHHEAAAGLQLDIAPEIDELIAEFERLVGGMFLLGERPARSVDEAVATGERLSALLLSRLLSAQGTPAAPVNSAGLIVTDAVFGNASPLMELTEKKTRALCSRCWMTGLFPSPQGSTPPPPTAEAPRWAAEVRIFPPPFSPQRSRPPNCGSGPMWMAS